MHRTQLFLPQDIHTELKRIAKERGVTLSELVRQILEEYLHKKSRSQTEKGIQTLLDLSEL